ncbi:spc98 like protein [Myriangium duriaei CBS 260.36]|uniref:Spc98 like protein n=1 Tax=Myriangium duriaei CBS 260.36 TaxID=1168546 RepID=A0A9P4J4V1_9PEZI|nr:spc98 like protein [Myriangium duriaei CBS 260.36]
MSASRDQRVDDALQQLVSRLIPSNPDGDEADEDQKWDESIALARRLIDAEPSPTTAEDVSHAADLIRAKLLRDTGRPEKATKFSNLYSRLLTQPVLGQKWAILYFLYKLAEPDTDKLRMRLEEIGSSEIGSPNPVTVAGRRTNNAAATGRVTSLDSRRTEPSGPATDDAFAKRGLPKLPRTEAPPSPKGRISREAHPSRPGSQRTKEEPDQDPLLIQQPADPTEAALLRDLSFTLQGLGSTNLPFRDQKTLRLPAGLPVPLVSLLHALAEPSLLYRHLAAYVDSPDGGLVGQSLRSAIGEELRSYLGLVATLEGQVRRALAQIDGDQSRRSLGTAGVTLKRCVVWTREATLGLRLMSMIVEESADKKGGPLISLIHTLSTSHGDPFVHTFATRILHKVTRPFYTMLQHWMFSGDLHDPYLEFFVSENADSEQTSATSIWTDKYTLSEALIPSILSPELAKKVFLVGKSLNFIRSSCSDSAWVEQYTASSSRELSFSDPSTLSLSIEQAYKSTTARVLDLMSNKFRLFDHLSALKKYLLLGQGDFIALLLESLAANLDGPANAQYRHHLTSALDHSIRNSNAQFDSPDMTRRLDARMLELSHGEIGWDVFTLEYRMDSPLDVVVGAWAQKQYLKIFNFLWRIKRVEFSLGQVWGRCMTGARGVLRFVDEKRNGEDGELREVWKRARGGLAAMVHFIGQLQYYILFEVIESGWEKLKGEMEKPSATLDTLIAAHTAYLTSITRKGLLAPSSSGSSSAANIDFTSQLHEILKLMLSYRDAVEQLYSVTLSLFTSRADAASRVARRTAQGKWGTSEADSPAPLIPLAGDEAGDGGEVGRAKKRLEEAEKGFRTRAEALLGDLAYCNDADMRFLGVVMNFNDVYRVVRRRRQHGHGADKGHGSVVRERRAREDTVGAEGGR